MQIITSFNSRLTVTNNKPKIEKWLRLPFKIQHQRLVSVICNWKKTVTDKRPFTNDPRHSWQGLRSWALTARVDSEWLTFDYLPLGFSRKIKNQKHQNIPLWNNLRWKKVPLQIGTSKYTNKIHQISTAKNLSKLGAYVYK